MTETRESYLRSPDLLSCGTSRLLIIDVQEKLVRLVPEHDRLIDRCRMLVQGAQLLDVPVDATEQYPKGLGGTVAELAALLTGVREKLRFSSAEVLDWGGAAEAANTRHQVVVAGLEAHVCVLQTVLDLLASGFQVYVVADALGSRHGDDMAVALARMSACGAVITTAEAVLFEWCEVAGTPEFKQISALVTGRAVSMPQQ